MKELAHALFISALIILVALADKNPADLPSYFTLDDRQSVVQTAINMIGTSLILYGANWWIKRIFD